MFYGVYVVGNLQEMVDDSDVVLADAATDDCFFVRVCSSSARAAILSTVDTDI